MPFLAGASSPASLSLVDAGNEPTSFRLYGTLITPDNMADQRVAWLAVVTAAMNLVLGAKKSESYGIKTDFLYSQPTNGAARELALLLQGVDSVTGQRLTARLGTINPTAVHYVFNLNARDVVLLTEPENVTLLLTAVNAFWVNPFTGNGVAVKGLKVTRGGK